MTIDVASPADLPATVGRTAVGDWFEISQDRIAAFADATEDHQWIHLDVERAAAGPFGATVAHGYLTLSLLPHLQLGLIEVGDVAMSVNYGLNKVRFVQPVPAGSRVRVAMEITSVEASAQGYRLYSTATVQLEGSERPAVVAETIGLFVPRR